MKPGCFFLCKERAFTLDKGKPEDYDDSKY